MTYLTLKIIALVTMTIDHLGLAISMAPFLEVPANLITLMRSIGRIAFPIFAFGIVNGMKHTRDRDRYFFRLSVFMSISQIPFSMIASSENYIADFRPADLLNLSFSIKSSWSIILASILLVLFFIMNRDRVKSCISMVFASLLSILSIYTGNGYVINSGSYLNIFYTLAVSAYLIKSLEEMRENDYEIGKSIINIFLLVSMISLFIPYSDYSFMGLILILGIYLLRESKALVLVFMLAWLFVQYGFMESKLYFILSCLSLLFIALYNGRKGQGPKVLEKFFYIYYPLHLAVGALLSIILI